ncbi:MAG TPA: DUF1080 domain-containing protein [Cytophagales bacterium]|nr:DUF1080 domain-containing protein [Cytophagales bacterium]
MRLLTLTLATIAFTFSFACQSQKSSDKSKKGWIVLFDGTNLDQWKGYNKENVPDGWEIINKELVLTKGGDGDIITKNEYENYELELEWKISEGGNSGIIFNIKEDPKFNNTYETGPEMQILDNEKHPDSNQGKNGNRKAGSLYDMIPSSVKANPAGEWNKVKIRIKDGKTQFWLNGQKTVEFEMWTDEWNELIADSKFKDWPGFAKYKKGHIGLQDHGDKVFFRNIRIREI